MNSKRSRNIEILMLKDALKRTSDPYTRRKWEDRIRKLGKKNRRIF